MTAVAGLSAKASGQGRTEAEATTEKKGYGLNREERESGGGLEDPKGERSRERWRSRLF